MKIIHHLISQVHIRSQSFHICACFNKYSYGIILLFFPVVYHLLFVLFHTLLDICSYLLIKLFKCIHSLVSIKQIIIYNVTVPIKITDTIFIMLQSLPLLIVCLINLAVFICRTRNLGQIYNYKLKFMCKISELDQIYLIKAFLFLVPFTSP